jgi:hypothetical protein
MEDLIDGEEIVNEMKKTGLNAWILPNGKCYECDRYGHSQKAWDIVDSLNIELLPGDSCGEDVLERIGSIKVSSSTFYINIITIIKSKITKKQFDELSKLFYTLEDNKFLVIDNDKVTLEDIAEKYL